MAAAAPIDPAVLEIIANTPLAGHTALALSLVSYGTYNGQTYGHLKKFAAQIKLVLTTRKVMMDNKDVLRSLMLRGCPSSMQQAHSYVPNQKKPATVLSSGILAKRAEHGRVVGFINRQVSVIIDHAFPPLPKVSASRGFDVGIGIMSRGLGAASATPSATGAKRSRGLEGTNSTRSKGPKSHKGGAKGPGASLLAVAGDCANAPTESGAQLAEGPPSGGPAAIPFAASAVTEAAAEDPSAGVDHFSQWVAACVDGVAPAAAGAVSAASVLSLGRELRAKLVSHLRERAPVALDIPAGLSVPPSSSELVAVASSASFSKLACAAAAVLYCLGGPRVCAAASTLGRTIPLQVMFAQARLLVLLLQCTPPPPASAEGLEFAALARDAAYGVLTNAAVALRKGGYSWEKSYGAVASAMSLAARLLSDAAAEENGGDEDHELRDTVGGRLALQRGAAGVVGAAPTALTAGAGPAIAARVAARRGGASSAPSLSSVVDAVAMQRNRFLGQLGEFTGLCVPARLAAFTTAQEFAHLRSALVASAYASGEWGPCMTHAECAALLARGGAAPLQAEQAAPLIAQLPASGLQLSLAHARSASSDAIDAAEPPAATLRCLSDATQCAGKALLSYVGHLFDVPPPPSDAGASSCITCCREVAVVAPVPDAAGCRAAALSLLGRGLWVLGDVVPAVPSAAVGGCLSCVVCESVGADRAAVVAAGLRDDDNTDRVCCVCRTTQETRVLVIADCSMHTLCSACILRFSPYSVQRVHEAFAPRSALACPVCNYDTLPQGSPLLRAIVDRAAQHDMPRLDAVFTARPSAADGGPQHPKGARWRYSPMDDIPQRAPLIHDTYGGGYTPGVFFSPQQHAAIARDGGVVIVEIAGGVLSGTAAALLAGVPVARVLVIEPERRLSLVLKRFAEDAFSRGDIARVPEIMHVSDDLRLVEAAWVAWKATKTDAERAAVTVDPGGPCSGPRVLFQELLLAHIVFGGTPCPSYSGANQGGRAGSETAGGELALISARLCRGLLAASRTTDPASRMAFFGENVVMLPQHRALVDAAWGVPAVVCNASDEGALALRPRSVWTNVTEELWVRQGVRHSLTVQGLIARSANVEPASVTLINTSRSMRFPFLERAKCVRTDTGSHVALDEETLHPKDSHKWQLLYTIVNPATATRDDVVHAPLDVYIALLGFPRAYPIVSVLSLAPGLSESQKAIAMGKACGNAFSLPPFVAAVRGILALDERLAKLARPPWTFEGDDWVPPKMKEFTA